MTKRTAVAAILWSVVIFAASGAAQEPSAEFAAVEAQEQISRTSIKALRDIARSLKRASKAMRSEDADAYASWLRGAAKRADTHARQWSNKLDYFYRDFPRQALLDDPERLTYALDWLTEINASQLEQFTELKKSLLEANESFASQAPASQLEAVRASLGGGGA